MRKGDLILPLSLCHYVSMAEGKGVFSKTAHRIFLKLRMKLGCHRGKKLTESDFWEGTHFGDNAQKHPQNRVSWILQKKK